MSEPLTIESCLGELREMFPREGYCTVEGTLLGEVGMRFRIGLRDINRHFNGRSLEGCMEKVRAFKQSQDNKESK